MKGIRTWVQFPSPPPLLIKLYKYKDKDMNKIIYLIRHSGTFVKINGYDNLPFEDQSKNMILSVYAERKAEKLGKTPEFNNIDAVYCSNSVRAIATAKYISFQNNDISLNVQDELNERKFGVKYIEELPDGFIQKQFEDDSYKLENGESLKEVNLRIKKYIENEILSCNNYSKVAIVMHGIAIMTYLKKFCNVTFNNDVFKVTYNNKVIYNSVLKAPEVFKLEFDDKNNVVDIENIKVGD